MTHEELVQQVAAVLRDSFKSIKDDELRGYMAAEKIVKTIIEPALREHEKQLLVLHGRRGPVFDS